MSVLVQSYAPYDCAKLYRRYIGALFKHAVKRQPSIIFIDEIDSLMKHRDQSDMAVTTNIKSALLKQWGKIMHEGSRVILVGTTNFPENLDKAFIRRFTHRFLVKPPTGEKRNETLSNMLAQMLATTPIRHVVRPDEMDRIWAYLGPDDSLTAGQLVQLVSEGSDICARRVKCTMLWVKVCDSTIFPLSSLCPYSPSCRTRAVSRTDDPPDSVYGTRRANLTGTVVGRVRRL